VIVGVAGVVVLSLLWFFLFWSPQSKRLDAAEQRKAAAEQTNSGLEVTLARLQDLEARRPELKHQLTQLRRAVPDQPQLASFLMAAHDAADRSGVQLVTVTPGKPAADTAAAATTPTTAAPTTGTAGGGTTTTTAAAGEGTTPTTTAAAAAPSAISLSFEVKGGYFQVLDFVNRVTDLPRIVVVDSLDLGAGEESAPAGGTGADTTSGSTELSASITARMFTGAAPEGTGTTPGGTTTPTTAATTATTKAGSDS
jgi:Tfp pilus assembly protein PilO